METPKAITISSLPPVVRDAISCDSPANVKHRDYIAVEHDVWDARAEIGDFPMTIISNDFGPDAPPGDAPSNAADQQGWLVLSPNSEQVVVTSGHDVVRSESALVTAEILAVLAVARGSGGAEATETTIVGSWHRAQSCEEMLAVFDAAGLDRVPPGLAARQLLRGRTRTHRGRRLCGRSRPAGALPLLHRGRRVRIA